MISKKLFFILLIVFFVVGFMIFSFQKSMMSKPKVTLNQIHSSSSEGVKMKDQGAFNESYPRPNSPFIQDLRNKNYKSIKKMLNMEAFSNNDLKKDNFFSQVIFYFDHDQPEQLERWNIIKILMEDMKNEKKPKPREIVLLGKIISKYEPIELRNKNEIELFFKKYNEKYPGAWLESSVSWNPLPKSTSQILKKYFYSNRSDEIQDFSYFVSKIKDKKALELFNVKKSIVNMKKK